VVLAWGDAGWVRFFSKEPAVRPDDYRKMKFFAWAGESEQQDIMKSLGYTPVPLETSDILPSIQTGMISAVPGHPLLRAGQPGVRHRRPHARHQLGTHRRRAGGHQEELGRDEPGRPATPCAGRRHPAGLQMRTQARKEVDEAVDAMKKRGLQVHTPNPEQMQEWNDPGRAALPAHPRHDGAGRNLRRSDRPAQGLPRRQALNPAWAPAQET
jgi:hypothetical protein